MLCRKKMWGAILDVATLATIPALVDVLNRPRYADVKSEAMLAPRRNIKEAVRKSILNGWAKNEGDEWFSLDGDIKA
jgi:tRNA-specific adenosine deaminase 1